MTEIDEVLVVGGGIAALSAALAARQAGASVHLVHDHRLGGRAQSDQRRGFIFNRGPHALYARGAGMAALDSLGIQIAGAKAPVPGARGLVGGELHLLPTTPGSLLRTDLFTLADRVAFGRLLTTLPKHAHALADRSAQQWIEQVAPRPAVAQVLAATLRLSTYSSDRNGLSADAAVAQLRLATSGVTYLHGGWQRMVDQLTDAARTAGVRFTEGQDVTRLETTDQGVTALAGEREVSARSVVVAVGSPALTRRLLPEAVPDELGPPVLASCLDLGLSALPRHRFILGIDEPLYCSLHAPDADLAPAGSAVLCAMQYGAPGEDTTERLDGLVAQAGVSPVSIVERRVLASMTVAHGQPLPGQGLLGRPPVAVTGRPHCFLAGDWVGPVGLLGDAALSSGVTAGKAAARAAVRHPTGRP